MSAHIENTLKRCMKEKGVTQKTLSQLTGLSQPYISQILSGCRAPTVDTLYALCSALNVSPGELSADAACAAAGLTSEELSLLFAYRSLSEADKALVQRMAAVLRHGSLPRR